MVFKISIRRTEIQKLKTGNFIMVDDEPCVIKSTERSKSGKHGHAKVRVSCIGMFDNNKRSLTFPSGQMVEVPEIIKGNAQINYIEDKLINVMDLESYDSVDIDWPKDEDLIKKLKELQADPSKMSSSQVDYWQLAGKTLINRVFTT
ncbi:MAG: translation initiation factor IF-5A [Promethearchaeota archaeon]|nr:MAG: translation initiation factor IF-5A [Candidatus Lokiarchaeota archaeon]